MRLLALVFLLILGGCAPSPSPDSEELIKTGIPTFNGESDFTATTATPAYVLFGKCDPKSVGLEYSFDESSWLSLAGGCSVGSFSIHLVVKKSLQVFVRAKTKMGFTQSAKALIRFVLPPTSPTFQVVSAGSAVETIDGRLQFSSSIVGSNEALSSPGLRLQSGITGIVYDGE